MPTCPFLPGGPIPPNPTELVARESLPQAIDILKKHFDYIILDTAPIGMVTDTQLISRVANASIYVCRADYTHKADYTLINELGEQKKLPNLMYHYQRTGHEEKEVRILLWIRQVWQVLRIW